jgi:hypothetical protein
MCQYKTNQRRIPEEFQKTMTKTISEPIKQNINNKRVAVGEGRQPQSRRWSRNRRPRGSAMTPGDLKPPSSEWGGECAEPGGYSGSDRLLAFEHASPKCTTPRRKIRQYKKSPGAPTPGTRKNYSRRWGLLHPKRATVQLKSVLENCCHGVLFLFYFCSSFVHAGLARSFFCWFGDSLVCWFVRSCVDRWFVGCLSLSWRLVCLFVC